MFNDLNLDNNLTIISFFRRPHLISTRDACNADLGSHDLRNTNNATSRRVAAHDSHKWYQDDKLSCQFVKLCDLKSLCFNCERFSPCIKASKSSSTLLIFSSAIQEIAAPLLVCSASPRCTENLTGGSAVATVSQTRYQYVAVYLFKSKSLQAVCSRG